MVAEECADLGSHLYRRATVRIHHNVDPGDRWHGHGELPCMRDQWALPWPGVGLPDSYPAGHHLGRGGETDDEHTVNRKGIDHAPKLERRFRRRDHQEQVPPRRSL